MTVPNIKELNWGCGPLSEPVTVYDTEAYMRHLTPLSVKMGMLYLRGNYLWTNLLILCCKRSTLSLYKCQLILYCLYCDACMLLSPPQEGIIVVQLRPNCGEINMFGRRQAIIWTNDGILLCGP